MGDLLDIASIDAGKLAISALRGDITIVLAEAVDTFEAAASASHLSLTLAVAERPLLAQFDYERMLQVMANLISNAIKFTPAGGAILVRAEREARLIRVSVTDTGPGIPPDLIEVVFERFRQVSESDSRGLGLGLYIAKCLIDAHGGAMWAESTLGAGTTVHFTLPSTEDRRSSVPPL